MPALLGGVAAISQIEADDGLLFNMS